jgi:hypothetical protein
MNQATRIFASILFALACIPAPADVIPPHVREARDRLQANPNTYDLADQFCTGKKRGDSCTLSGTPLEGAGSGLCQPEIAGKIQLTCIRNANVTIDRQIPAGGFVSNDWACQRYLQAVSRGQPLPTRPSDCEPPAQPVTDRFCRGVVAGNPCMAEVQIDGRTELNPGVCKEATEYGPEPGGGSYSGYGGRRGPVRSVLKCEPAKVVEHVYSPASWLDKLRQ